MFEVLPTVRHTIADQVAPAVFAAVGNDRARHRLTERTLAALLAATPTAVAVLDSRNGQLLAANGRFAALVGRPAAELVGLSPPFPWLAGNAFEAAGDGVFLRPDGRPQPVRVSVHPASGGTGEPELVLQLVEDLGEAHRLQQQLAQTGKLAAIGELAAGVAHEINNPLFAILGLTEFLLEEAELQSKAHQRLELIQQTGLEIKEIVRALLDFARENAEDRQLVTLEEIVRSTVDLVRRTNAHKGIELADTYGEEEAPVRASPNQLKQICLNLIANARQAMPEGGTVSIDARRLGDAAVVTVSDEGPGIEPEVLARIFEPFFTTRRHSGGTGLGLSVSLGIAEAHGGTLTVASEPGRGSAFTLRLPLVDEES